MSHLVLIAALWGVIASFLNELIKQDGLPKTVNTVIADAVLVVTAAFVTLNQSGNSTLTWHLFSQALFGAVTAALVNHQFLLVPTGLGAKIQTATSVIKAPAAA